MDFQHQYELSDILIDLTFCIEYFYLEEEKKKTKQIVIDLDHILILFIENY